MNNRIITKNPHNGLILQEYSPHTPEQLLKILADQYTSQKIWRQSPYSLRAEYFKKLAQVLLKNKEKYAQIIHSEMGKKIAEAISEVEKCASCAEFYADNGEKFLEPQLIKTEAKKSYISFQPIGTVLAIMPWNFPFWQAFRAAIPAIFAGNTVILKHASNVSGSALLIESVFREAFPTTVLQTILLDGSRTLDLLSLKEIAGVTFTGSTNIGRKIGEAAGKNLKKSVLELGGSDPYLVFENADLDLAASACAYSRLINSGQSCIAAKRIVVHKNILSTFLPKFQKALELTELAPMAREDLRAALHQQVLDSVNLGAKVLCGGKIPIGPGYFYPATILTHLKPGMPAYEQELFGPVASVIEAFSDEEAIQIANNSSFGLGAAIFSQTADRAEELARDHLEAGSVFINNFVRSDTRLPFGGIKESGYGRELSDYGLKEFTNIKTIWVD